MFQTRIRWRAEAGPTTSTPDSSRDAANLSATSIGLSSVEPPSNESILILDVSTDVPEQSKLQDKKRCGPKCQKGDSLNILKRALKCQCYVKHKGKGDKRASMSFTGDERRKKNFQVDNVASDSSADRAQGRKRDSLLVIQPAQRCRCVSKPKIRPEVSSDEEEKQERRHQEEDHHKAASERSPAIDAEGRAATSEDVKQQDRKTGRVCRTTDSLLVIEMAKLCLCNGAKDKQTNVSFNEMEKRESKKDYNAALELSSKPVVVFDRVQGRCGPLCRKRDSLLVIEPAQRCGCFEEKKRENERKQMSLSLDGHEKREKIFQDVANSVLKPEEPPKDKVKVQCDCLKVKKAADKRKLKKDEKEKSKNQVGPNESIGAGSAVSAVSELCAAECFQSKLLATMRILENKEETIRVQAQSLAVAEQRIAALTERADLYRRQLNQYQLQSPRSPAPPVAQKADISINTDAHQEEVCQRNIVSTLQDNLSVIEELYRECFYESAKQEELIDLLRNSCSDVRVMEKHKTEQIGLLQNVVNSQKWSLDKCQDIATEVETLKMEISNFLNSSNHDSGMWEAQGVQGAQGEELTADLHHVAAQLLRLRDLLTQSECICGLKEENMKLRQKNNELEAKDKKMEKRVQELEAALQAKNKENLQRDQQLDMKDQECRHVSQQLTVLQQNCKDQAATCESLTRQLQNCQTMLTTKSAEVARLQRQCEARESSATELREQLSKAQLVAEQEAEVREEVRVLSRSVCSWRAQLAACQQRMRRLELELQKARDYCDHLAHHYREKESTAMQLQNELEEAHSRGAQLCNDTRALVAGLRCWLRRHKDRIREQEDKINEQDELIRTLQLSSPRAASSPGDDQPCCSRCPPPGKPRRDDGAAGRTSERANCTKCVLLQQTSSDRANEVHHHSTFCRAEGARGTDREPTSGSEITSRSSPPKPPRRILRKKRPPSLNDCSWTRCEVAIQRPVRCEAATGGSDTQCGQVAQPGQHAHHMRGAPCDRNPRALCDCWSAPDRNVRNREVSAAEELLERVEGAQHALHAAHARWHSHTDTSAARRTRQTHTHKM